jgi:hypothetical protein
MFVLTMLVSCYLSAQPHPMVQLTPTMQKQVVYCKPSEGWCVQQWTWTPAIQICGTTLPVSAGSSGSAPR